MSFKCTFVHTPDPTYADHQNYGVEFMPTWIFTLASHIPESENYKLDFYDTRFDQIEDIQESDVFLFSGINQDYNMLLKVWGNLKEKYPHAKAVIGGPICWSFMQVGDLNLLKSFDHIFIGDGEAKIAEILKKIANKEDLPHIIHNPERFKIADSKHLYRPFLSKSIGQYYGVVIEVSRGCPFLCEFCDIRIMNDNNRAHNKSPDLIVSEIEYVLKQGKNQFILACDNFIGEQAWAEEVADKMIEMIERTGLQPKIYTWLTINIAKNLTLMKKMRQAGFELLFIGVESFNVNSLIETAKVQNTARLLIDDIRTIQSFGFIIVAGLIFGFDTDQEDCFDITLMGLKDSGLISGDPSFLTALPGTPLYRRMKLTNRIRESGHLMSSTSTGGVKYQTNIKYLISKNKFISGFQKFVKGYNQGKFQFQRLHRYFTSINENKNFIALQQGKGGFGSLSHVLKMIFKNPRSVKQLLKRGLLFALNPTRVFYAFKGIFFVARQKHIPGRMNQLQFWLFAWSNYVLKYSNLKASDFDIDNVPEDFDYSQLIPKNYRETATESIPKAKIDAQVKATSKGLQSVIERMT